MTEPATLFKLAEDMRRETENVVNRLHRHCRIGRITKKMMIHGGEMVKLPKGWTPDPLRQAISPMFMDKCGCRVGSACGNSACPHGVIATCAA